MRGPAQGMIKKGTSLLSATLKSLHRSVAKKDRETAALLKLLDDDGTPRLHMTLPISCVAGALWKGNEAIEERLDCSDVLFGRHRACLPAAPYYQEHSASFDRYYFPVEAIGKAAQPEASL